MVYLSTIIAKVSSIHDEIIVQYLHNVLIRLEILFIIFLNRTHLFIPGKEIIENAALPIGSLSEEAQEARNKDYKRYRLNHNRKCSRVSTNEDIMHMMLVSSDPLITSLRNNPCKKNLEISEEAKDLLCLE